MKGPIESVRAGNEGHSFHHAWAARTALELVDPASDLKALAIEGFSTEDDDLALSQAATEIADLTAYRGGRGSLTATQVHVKQFKYSVARADVPVRAADAATTVKKFANAFRDLTAALGRDAALAKLRFSYVTNRPIAKPLAQALTDLEAGIPLVAGSQAEVLREASGLAGEDIRAFAARLSFEGASGSARGVEAGTQMRLAAWGPAHDSLARLRLLELQKLVRDKAGIDGQGANFVTIVDVLGTLGIPTEADLFPAPAAFPVVSNPIARQATADLLALSARTRLPVLAHAVGGMGKTVLLQSTAAMVGSDTHVVIFDGYGGGRWRDPSAPRHLPNRGLIHLANQLAADGLCDPMLPGMSDTGGLLAGFRLRLAQAVETLAQRGRSGGILLLLDAIDHSGERARDTQTDSFPKLLIESLSVAPEPGVSVIASCRSHRRDAAVGAAAVELFDVPPFTREESDAVVIGRFADASPVERTAVYARSGGNPRLLSTLLNQGRPFDPLPAVAGEGAEEALDRLLAKQVADARANAIARGASATELDALLAGLAFLPPAVPVEELAATQAMSADAVQSFANDLFPLIETTPQGLIFRDEPTETFVRRRAAPDIAAQTQVLARLDQRQTVSNYAARALPGVLRDLGRTPALYALASDDRLPVSATSGVAQRAIRLARLEAALHVAAVSGDVNQALRFCLDLARLAAGHGRSDGYLRRNPDLVAIADDPEALRRMFEDRGGWGGSRHAALSVIEMMRGNSAEAMRQASRSFEWNNWRAQLPEDDPHNFPPIQPFDISGPAWVAVRHGMLGRIARWFLKWDASHSYTMAANVVGLLEAHARLDPRAAFARDRLYRILARLASPPPVFLLAVLGHARVVDADVRIALLSKLATTGTTFDEPADYRLKERRQVLTSAVTRAAATAVALGRPNLAEPILALLPMGRVSTHDFEPPTINRGILVDWLLSGLVRAAAQEREVRVLDLAPRELDVLVRLKRDRKSDSAYAAAVTAALEKLKAKAARRKKKKRDWPRRSESPEERLKGHLTSHIPAWVTLLDGLPGLIARGELETAVRTLYDRADALVAKTSNYSHRDQKRFVSDHTGGLADALLSAAPALAEKTGRRAVQFAMATPYRSLAGRIDLVSLLGRHDAAAPVAVELAGAISAKLEEETSTDTRIRLTADLARAIWPVSPAEAKVVFRAGLSLADSFSADDMEETLGLLEVARHYEGPPIPPGTVHGFSRICEMQMPDESDRYDWLGYADAFARLGGLQLLPLLTRLKARSHGGIGDAHLECMAKLVQAGRLDADLAAGMVGLFEYADMLRFRLPTFIEHLLPTLSPASTAALFAFAEVELDRVDGATPANSLIVDLLALAQVKLPPDNLTRQRLAALARPEDKSASSQSRPAFSDGKHDPSITAFLGEGIRFTADEMNAIALSLPKKGNGRPVVQLLRAIADRQTLPDDRLAFLDAVAEAQAISLDDKLIALKDLLGAWSEGSAAVRAALPDVVLRLTRRHAQDLIRGGRWNGGFSRRWLLELANGVASEPRLVTEILQRLGGQAAIVSSSAWLEFAEVLSRVAQPSTIADCLARYVEKSEAGLPDAVAGGPWRLTDLVPASAAAATAGLLWSLLGSSDAPTRWRAAHAVRRVVGLGRTDVLEHLVGLLNNTDGGVFQDPATPFFFLNAKLWLLLTLARLAVDDPALVGEYRAQLEEIAYSAELPHVLIREMAARALRAFANSLPPAEAESLRAFCATVNASPWPTASVERSRGAGGFYDRRPDNYPAREPEFHFDYDFEKYQVTGLATLFGTHKYEAGDRIVDWIHVWAPNAGSMWDDYRGDEWGGSRRQTMESHIGNLAWHGVFLAAGTMLQTHPISGRSWSSAEPWAEWLADGLIAREDGRWLADDTSLTPIDLRAPLTTGDDPVPRLSRSLAGFFVQGAGAGFVVVEGSWDTIDGADVSISSAFVPRADAEVVALTVALAYQHDVWVPRADEIHRHLRQGTPWRGWLMLDEARREGGLDKDDPYTSNAARYRTRPTDAIIRSGNLKADPPFNRRWRLRGGKVLADGLAWGMRRGRGEHEKVYEGRRLTANLSWIRDLCRHRNQSLVIVVKASRYLEKMSGDAAFPTRWLVATIDRDGELRPLLRIPAVARKAVLELGPDRRREFKDRLEAVREALAKAPPASRRDKG